MHPSDAKSEALRLIRNGLNDCEVARRLAIPRTTVRDWRKPPYVAQVMPACPLCGDRSRGISLEPETYAELLGLYLGDGHITTMSRAARLRLFLDAKFPVIVDESEAILRAVLPGPVSVA